MVEGGAVADGSNNSKEINSEESGGNHRNEGHRSRSGAQGRARLLGREAGEAGLERRHPAAPMSNTAPGSSVCVHCSASCLCGPVVWAFHGDGVIRRVALRVWLCIFFTSFLY